jgi:hypothetical protein
MEVILIRDLIATVNKEVIPIRDLIAVVNKKAITLIMKQKITKYRSLCKNTKKN